jgi:tetratricopeptide (TPR) repeat protein
VRVVDGREIEGRYIGEDAYAAYLRAADAEAHGDRVAALQYYEAAASSDTDSPEVWTRIGAVRCAASTEDPRAQRAFERALGSDPEYEPAWRELARCELARGHVAEASRASDRALLLDPDCVATSVLHAEITQRSRGDTDARHELEALVVRTAGAIEAWRALRELGERTRDKDLVLRATAAIRARNPTAPEAANLSTSARLTEIDEALARGDLALARTLATRSHRLASELALRAAALGKVEIARTQAELVLGADPTDASSLIASAVAADLAKDEAGVARALVPFATSSVTPPSRLAELLFAELLERRAGASAARAWLRPAPIAKDDPLLAGVEARVSSRLAEDGTTPQRANTTPARGPVSP